MKAKTEDKVSAFRLPQLLNIPTAEDFVNVRFRGRHL